MTTRRIAPRRRTATRDELATTPPLSVKAWRDRSGNRLHAQGSTRSPLPHGGLAKSEENGRENGIADADASRQRRADAGAGQGADR